VEDTKTAAKTTQLLKTKTVDQSGWHVYNNMEQILAYCDSNGTPLYREHMLPKTDDILSRSINLSVGVLDPGLGSDFGINVLSTNDEIDSKAEEFIRLMKPVLG
jgi:hypothetical protein